MVPLHSINYEISGVQLYLTYNDDVKKVLSLRDFSHKYGDYIFRNRITKSGYKIINKGLCDEFCVLTVKLSRELQIQKNFLSKFENEQVLKN